MKVVGITGGIGSGKSTVSAVLLEMGYPVYNADERAKELLNSSADLKSAITAEFGDEIYADGILDRAALAAQVFNDREKLAKLNALVHPAVAKDFYAWRSAQTAPAAFKEAAILFESGADKGVDEVVLVSAPEEVRVFRVMARDGVSADEVKSRIANQWNEERKRELADHEVVNDGQTLVIPQINALLDLWVK